MKKRKKRSRRAKSRKAALFQRVKNAKYLSGKQLVIETKDELKMSKVILDFAEPLLSLSNDDESEKKAISLAVLVWNISLFPKDKQEDMINEMISNLSSSNIEDIESMKYCISMLMERKRKYFSKNQRVILDYQISGSRNDRRLYIVSTLSLAR